MKVLVDTDVWSEAFRRSQKQSEYVQELTRLVEEGRVQLIGPIRMEILCGLRSGSVFERYAERLAAFRDRELTSEIFVEAARMFNLCRGNGIQGSNTDFVICACSALWEMPILSKDKDYLHYRKYLPIHLATVRSGG